MLLVAPFMAQADAAIANVATPSIQADLGASGAMLELVIGGHLIAFAALLISGARLGQSHGYPGLTLVPWVAAFGLAGQLVRRLTPLALPLAPVSGCLLLAASYAAISLALFGGHHDEALLIVLLAAGGLGLGIQFSALIAHLAVATPADLTLTAPGTSVAGLMFRRLE